MHQACQLQVPRNLCSPAHKLPNPLEFSIRLDRPEQSSTANLRHIATML